MVNVFNAQAPSGLMVELVLVKHVQKAHFALVDYLVTAQLVLIALVAK